ncbi:hypothetical protein MJO28_015469 [Puccinia striiformis f. sp. tritici]|uniref:Uncharacterized protein n=1 Tax=Puccinia striiformis f. sp. tritici TaxID=168172 RepID=A0ACC0DU51_9BASI|nr:hypothetical protein MJO28_015469 [Puccinia striiformis f. sp. tritici]
MHFEAQRAKGKAVGVGKRYGIYLLSCHVKTARPRSAHKKADPPAIETRTAKSRLFPLGNQFVHMKVFFGQPWLLLFHTNTALSSIFAASPSQTLAVRPTLSLEWQENEIHKYLSEPLSFPQPTLPLGYSQPAFHTESNNPQELQHHSPPNVFAFEVDHNSNTPLPPSSIFTSSGVLSELAPDAQLTPNHNDLARKRKVHESIPKADFYPVLARKKTKAPKENKENVLHVDHSKEALPKPTRSDQSNGRKARRYTQNIKHVAIETLVNLSDAKIRMEKYPLFNEIMNPRKSELQKWKSKKINLASDEYTRVRIIEFLKNVTKMSTFLIISHVSFLNGQMNKEITQGDVENVLKFMKDFWEKMHNKEPLLYSRSYTWLPLISNLMDPNDTHTYQFGHKGRSIWYEVCEEIVEYWTEHNMNLSQRSSSAKNCQSDTFKIRKTGIYCFLRSHVQTTPLKSAHEKAEPPAIEPGSRFAQMKAFSSQPWLLFLHANSALSSIFAASPSRVKEETSAVTPTLSLEWQGDEIRKYLSEPLSFPQSTPPLGYSKPTFLTRINPQELQHHPHADVLALEVDHTSNALLPSNDILTPSGVFASEDVPTCKSDRILASKKIKVPKENKENFLHADHPEELPKPTQSDHSKGRKARGKRTHTKRVILKALIDLSDSKMQIDNNPLFNDIIIPRKSKLQNWESNKSNPTGDARTRYRIIDFLEGVTKMSTFLIISHASFLNGQMKNEINQGEVENVLKFMKDFWEKMDRRETLASSRLYTSIPKIPNLLDPNDTHTYQQSHTGHVIWYEVSEEIVEYWTEKNKNLLQRSSSNSNHQSDEFDIRNTVNSIIADKTDKRFTKDKNGAIMRIRNCKSVPS